MNNNQDNESSTYCNIHNLIIICVSEQLRNALNRGMKQDVEKRTSMELTQAVPQTDILGNLKHLTLFAVYLDME